MAAYGALVSLIRTLDTVLHPGAPPISLSKTLIQSLRQNFTFLLQFLDQNSSENTINQEIVENLETLIRKTAYKAEDLIESQMYKDHNSIWPLLCSLVQFLLILSILVSSWLLPDAKNLVIVTILLHVVNLVIGLIPKWVNFIVKNVYRDHELIQVLEEAVCITKEVIEIKDKFGVEDYRPISRNLVPDSDSGGATPGNDVVVGFECDLEEIRDRLSGASSKLDIVSIVGVGGIGKTTLARTVYGDSYIVYHFRIRAWVTVSRECSLRQVVLGLLDSVGILTQEMREECKERLCVDLHKSLKGRRYLIVMDDMWGTEIWDAVRRYFPDDCNGSRVLLTTRLLGVAGYVNSVSLHRMHFLNEDDSWSLLCRKVFLAGEDCPLELIEVGKMIARDCGGLPLAIVVIGGLLHKGEKTQEYWRRIAGNLDLIISEDTRCMEILSLSYNHLPHRLRPCFLYMGLFPEDYEIPVPRLIRLWVAEGFLKPTRSKRFEELAEEYLEDLIKRNLVMVSKRSSNGKIKTCYIHDLLWNFDCINNTNEQVSRHSISSTEHFIIISSIKAQVIIKKITIWCITITIDHSMT